MRDRWIGLFWFAFIPATLTLMLRLPLGEGWSLALAALVIGVHRPLASRFVYGRGTTRCLWCGGPARDPEPVSLEGLPELRVCRGEAHGLDRFLNACALAAPGLRALILAPVALYFLLGFASAAGWPWLGLEARRLLFRVPVALAVVGVALGWRHAPALRPARFPFPIHNLALLGVRWTLWVFLLVGLAWLWSCATLSF